MTNTNTTTKKATKKEMFAQVKEILVGAQVGEELVAFVDHEIELLERKASTGAQSKTQKENEPIKTAIVAYLETQTEPKSITDMIKGSEELGEYTNQKLSALIKQLMESGKVVKTTEKGKSLFSV